MKIRSSRGCWTGPRGILQHSESRKAAWKAGPCLGTPPGTPHPVTRGLAIPISWDLPGSRGSCSHTRMRESTQTHHRIIYKTLQPVKSIPHLCFYLKGKSPRSHKPLAFSEQTLQISRALPHNGSSCFANNAGILLELFPCLPLFTQ